MSVEIRTVVYNQLAQRAEANNITIGDLTNAIFKKMLFNHHEEVHQLIKQMKGRK